MTRHASILILIMISTIVVASANPGKVVVLANKDLPKSIELAKYYMKKRGIPAQNLIALSLPTDEKISREDYTEKLEEPLKQALRDRNLIKQRMRANIFKGERKIHWATSEVNFFALVSMYGVPVRILDTKPKLAQAIQNRTGFAGKMMQRNGAAVDSELSCLLLEDYERAGPFPNPSFNGYGFTQFDNNRVFIMATRLDGPGPEVVRNMIDGALEAETYGLRGGAYVDKFGIYNVGNIWMEEAYQRLKRAGMEIYAHQNPESTWKEEYPMDTPAVYFGWYAKEVDGPFLRPDTRFARGAVAYHLHSFSAMELRSENKFWAGPLLARGAAATMGCVDEPYINHTPNLDIFANRLCMGFTFGESAYMSLSSLSWQVTVIGDPLYVPFKPNLDQQISQVSRDQVVGLDWLILRRANLLARDSQLNSAMDVVRNGIRVTNSWRLIEKMGDLYAANSLFADARVEFNKAIQASDSSAGITRLAAKLILLCKLLGQPEVADQIKQEVQTGLGDSPLANYLENIEVPARLEPSPQGQPQTSEVQPASPAANASEQIPGEPDSPATESP